jgi:hypothetical protein
VFADVISAGSADAVQKKFPLIKLPRKRYPEPRSPLVEAYLYFYSQVGSWVAQVSASTGQPDEKCAFALLQALQQDFCVVEIALSEGDDSQEIFYSLNSQGRPLSQSDLLRSLIFMRAEKEKQNRDEIFNQYWSEFETTFWSTEVQRAGRSYSRLDLGLRFFLMAKTGGLVDARRVNEEYRSWVSTTPARYQSIRDELSDFSRHCEIFKSYEVIEPNLPSTDFRRFLRDLDVSTALPLVMYLKLEAGLTSLELSDCLSMLESFIARRVITGEETKEYNKLFVEIIGSLKAAGTDQISVALRKKLLHGGGSTRTWPTDDAVVEAAISRPMFNAIRTPALRLILERLEIAHRGKKSEEHAIAEGLQIEHVLPVKWADHWKLNARLIPSNVVAFPYLADHEFAELQEAVRVRNEKLQTIGNLTLLNKYLNPAASNGSFETKRTEYVHSVLRLNRYFDSCKTWDEEAINQRGKALGQLICEVWPHPGND